MFPVLESGERFIKHELLIHFICQNLKPVNMKKILMKVSCIALLGMLGINKLKAQNWEWAESLGGSSNEQAWAVATDPSGNVYTTGSFNGTATFGSINLVSSGSTDIFLVKQDKSGAVLWAVKAGGTGAEEGQALVVDEVGNCFVGGYFNGSAVFGSTTLVSAGAKDAFVARYDASGNAIWATNYGGTSQDEVTAIAINGSGNHADLRVGGFFNGTATFGSTTLISSGSQEVFIVACTGGGFFSWANKYGGTGSDDIQGMAMDDSDNLYITGGFQNSMIIGSVTLTSSGANDMYISKLNSSGAGIWAKQGGGTSFDSGQAIDLDKSGNVYVSGKFASGTFTSGASSILHAGGGYDAFLVKYDNSGTLTWLRHIAYGSGNCFAPGLGVDDGGDYIYVAGEFANWATMGSTTVYSAGSVDTYILRVDKSGILGFVYTGGGTYQDHAMDLALNKLDHLYIAGHFTSNTASFGTATINTAGSLDAFTASFNVALWPVKAGGTGLETAQDMVVDAVGNSYVTGQFRGTANFSGTNLVSGSTFGNSYVAKYNSSGKLMWVKKDAAGGACTGSESFGVTVDASGNVYTAGRYTGTATFGAQSVNSSPACNGAAFIVKYDDDGIEQWAVNLTPLNQYGLGVDDIVCDASSNLYVIGWYKTSVTIGPYVLNTTTGAQATYIACFNSSGVCQWAITNTGTATDCWGKGLATNGTNLYAVGHFTGTAGFGAYSASSSGTSDVYLAKFNMSGTCLGFVAGGSSTGYDTGNAISLDASGNIYMTGVFAGSATFGSQSITSAGSDDVFTCKYTSALSCSWARSGGGSSGYDRGYAIHASTYGIFVTGYTISNGAFGSISYSSLGGPGDVFITKYNSSGTPQYVKQMGGTSSETGTGIGVDDYGNVYVAGVFSGTGYFGSANLTAGSDDMFIEKLSYFDGTFARTTTATLNQKEKDQNAASAIIYPNPSTGIFYIDNASGNIREVKVYDITGKLVLHQKEEQPKAQIDISGCEKGLYLLEITGETRGVYRVILE
jgi:hypothetical protein